MSTRCLQTVVGLLLYLGFSASGLVAQTSMDKATAKAADAVQHESADAKSKAGTAEPSIAIPDPPSDVILNDMATRSAYLKAMQRYYEYWASGYAHRTRVFEWQLVMSLVIFLVVLLLVGAGMYFAAVQFHVAMVAVRGGAAPEPPDQGGTTLATRLEVSAKGIVVNSSVLGVVILTLSLAFFYLYLVHVYRIQNVF